jgi:hypothetical protein
MDLYYVLDTGTFLKPEDILQCMVPINSGSSILDLSGVRSRSNGGSNGDVVAQLAKATGRHLTEDAAVPGSNPAPPQSPERGQDI